MLAGHHKSVTSYSVTWARGSPVDSVGIQFTEPPEVTMTTRAKLVKSLKRLQIALGEFCCDNCISHDDMEESHSELLNASNEADELLAEIAASEPVSLEDSKASVISFIETASDDHLLEFVRAGSEFGSIELVRKLMIVWVSACKETPITSDMPAE